MKKTLMAAERGRAPIPEDRQAWRTKRQPLMRTACHRLAFLDETSLRHPQDNPPARTQPQGATAAHQGAARAL